MQNFDSIAELLNQDRRGYTLPQGLYTSEEAFRFDTEVMLKKVWLYACTVAHVKKPGDYFVFDLANNSVIITRGRDGEIRAFYNTCTHRGAKLCEAQKGSMARVMCPYHFWTFGLDGKLIVARGMPEGFDKAQHGLREVALENVGGLIFICLADNPPPIDRAKADISEAIALYDLSKLKVAAQDDLYDQANWKLVMENNRECYHCESNHPELLNSLNGAGFGRGNPEEGLSEDTDAVAKETAHWKELGIYRDLIEFPDNWWHRVARLGLAHGAVSQTLDGKPASKKLIWPIDHAEPTSISVWTHPNSWHHFMCDHVVSFSVVPVGPDKTLVRTTWLVHEDAVEGEDYTVENLTAVWKATNQQDRKLAELNHAGIGTDGYRPGLYAVEENLVDAFKTFYVEQSKLALEPSA
ncbi:Rieske (2Fe-2S) domain-containing protein [Novosphingobium nitrogenifigens DSM 19370]|uniref:Rieske (2Fe-2S) domain-containing protein n=1 Tax=Novosphingobium nitrogenifigens DSM 19370 TaxID=983920 RepID=F1ZAU4_9SPHN|nr:aromatic ring-hydroxylating dioxygenase subunit alpha [Novosphingobium nitrogenifigens]EGD58278.1 Rieske (2Fe-2S) domain-containing protein [Novosphingobium nitrogenifigens DSM 19370]